MPRVPGGSAQREPPAGAVLGHVSASKNLSLSTLLCASAASCPSCTDRMARRRRMVASSAWPVCISAELGGCLCQQRVLTKRLARSAQTPQQGSANGAGGKPGLADALGSSAQEGATALSWLSAALPPLNTPGLARRPRQLCAAWLLAPPGLSKAVRVFSHGLLASVDLRFVLHVPQKEHCWPYIRLAAYCGARAIARADDCTLGVRGSACPPIRRGFTAH